MIWTLKGYVLNNGENVVDEWYCRLSPKAQAVFDARWDHLSVHPRSDWAYPYFKMLSGGKCSGLGEIRFKADNVQQRPIGYFGPARGEFTILICAIEKGSRFEPLASCEIAQGRKSRITAHKERASEPQL